MIWLVGNKGMLGSEVELILKEKRMLYFATDKEVDITNYDRVKEFIKDKNIEYVINCSAYTNVDKAEEEQELAFLINGEGVKNLSKIVKEKNGILIHISTDYVFDGKSNEPYKEEDIPAPSSIYGKSKLQGEEYIKEIINRYFIIRTAWLYGFNGKNFVYTMLNLFKQRNEIKVVSDQFGTPTYAKDLAEIIIMFIIKKINDFGIFHFTNDGSTNWYNFAKKIYVLALEAGLITNKVNILPIKTEEYPTPAIRPKYSVLDKSKIKNILQIEIRNWEIALKEFISYIKDKKRN